MTVEILQSDTPEEADKKIQVLLNERKKRDAERKDRIKSFSGILTREGIDPFEIQKKLRNEWD